MVQVYEVSVDDEADDHVGRTQANIDRKMQVLGVHGFAGK